MKKLILTAMCVVMAAGAAQATDYTWIGVSAVTARSNWDNALNWSTGTVPTADNTANVIINNGHIVYLTTTPKTIGALTVSAAGSRLTADSNNGGVLNVTNLGAGAGSGNLTMSDFSAYNNVPSYTWNIWGNLIATNETGAGTPGHNVFVLRGTNKYYRWNASQMNAVMIDGGSVYDNGSSIPNSSLTVFTVKNNGRIIKNPLTNSMWTGRQFLFQNGQANLPNLGDCVDFVYQCDPGDNNTGRLVVTSGLIYPRDVFAQGISYSGQSLPKNSYVTRLKGGALTVGRDLYMQPVSNPNIQGEFWFDTTENGTTITNNALTIDRNLIMDEKNRGDELERHGLRLNNSQVRVGADIMIAKNTASNWTTNNAAIDFGNATVRLGGNFTVQYRPGVWATANWNAGTSTVICDGNGTQAAYVNHATQTLKTFGDCGLALNNLIVNNIGGVTLFNGAGGGLKLTGNLDVENGSFVGNKMTISFNGPSHTLTNKVLIGGSYNFDDNIALLTNTTVLALGSDITIKSGDNLTMASGSIIYLCGHVLKDEGKTYDGSLWGTVWTNTEGTGSTIYALSNVPEPATLATFATAALAVLTRLRRRRLA